MIKNLLSWVTPYMLWIRLALAVAVIITAFYAGIKTQQTLDKAENTTAYQEIIISMGKTAVLNKKLIEDQQVKEANLEKTYIKLEKELKNAKGKLASCKAGGSIIISDTGSRLWDSLNKGEASSTDSTGTLEGSPSSNPAITLEDLYENLRKNAKICNAMREQIRGIIAWDKGLDK